MSGLSCFGNFSMGELGDFEKLSFDSLNIESWKTEGFGGGKCIIPGFTLPDFPNFELPPFPSFGGIPPFPLFCILPPFPGIPAITIPVPSISIPPLPFLPPIPIPIPIIVIPTIPTLPSFDLGSLDFFCGLFHIDFPVFDPFAFLNDLVNKLNALIGALNDFLNFCKENAEAIAATEVPPALPASVAGELSDDSPAPPTAVPPGIVVPLPGTSEPSPSTPATSQESPVVDELPTAVPTAPASSIAPDLANMGFIPPVASFVNMAAQALAPLGTVADLTPALVTVTLASANVPSAEGFIGFTPPTILNCLEANDTAAGFIACLIANGFLCDNKNAKEAAFECAKKVYAAASPDRPDALEMSICLNSNGVPFNCPGETLARITEADIARAFFIRSTTTPFTAENITSTLVETGVMDNDTRNVLNTIDILTILPSPLTPKTLEIALNPINPGPSIGSLKAACIAASRGINPETLITINQARKDAVLQGVSDFKGNALIDGLLSLTEERLRGILREVGLLFPLSIYDLVPILSIELDVDDLFFLELFALFTFSNPIQSLSDLFSILQFMARAQSSHQSALIAIQDCDSIKEGDFVYSTYEAAVVAALSQPNLERRQVGTTNLFPSDEAKNQTIATVLNIENGYNHSDMITAFKDLSIANDEEASFYILGSGILRSFLSGGSSSADPVDLSGLFGQSGVLLNPIRIAISSPTNIALDIDEDNLNITLKTQKNTSLGVTEINHIVMKDGSPTSGTTLVKSRDDFAQILEITVYRISDYIESLEAIKEVVVDVTFSTILTEPQAIPQTLISVQ